MPKHWSLLHCEIPLIGSCNHPVQQAAPSLPSAGSIDSPARGSTLATDPLWSLAGPDDQVKTASPRTARKPAFPRPAGPLSNRKDSQTGRHLDARIATAWAHMFWGYEKPADKSQAQAFYFLWYVIYFLRYIVLFPANFRVTTNLAKCYGRFSSFAAMILQCDKSMQFWSDPLKSSFA